LGVSNFDVTDLEEARGFLVKHPIVCNQVLYNLRERYIENGLIDYCARNRIAVVGYSPFGTGAFPGPGTPGGDVLTAVAARHGANVTARQVTLAFLARAAPLFAIPKASHRDHVEENAGALSLRLSDADVAEIDGAFQRPEGQNELPTG
jgi:diketogulonate reductase-like aldo/keto reductase